MSRPASHFYKNQRRKNLAVLMVLLVLIALVFAITLMKMADSDLVSALENKAGSATPARH